MKIGKEKRSFVNYLEYCTFIKTILMVIVILGHSICFWTGNWFTNNPKISSPSLEILYNWLNSFHIYAFTLVSGYIFAFKMSKGDYKEYIPFIKNKAKRLIIPYVFTATVWVIPISQYFFDWDAITLIKQFILCENPSQLWFLWMLFDVFMIMWPLWKFISRRSFLTDILMLFFYIVGIIGTKVFPNIFCIWSAFQFIPFFYIGIQIWLKHEDNETTLVDKIPWWLWLSFDLAIFAFVKVIEIKTDIPGLGILTSFVTYILGALMAVSILQKIAQSINYKMGKNNAFSLLSKYSMPMYLFHQQIIYFVITGLNGKVNPYINAGINFLVSTIVSFIISWILLRFRITKFLVGEGK